MSKKNRSIRPKGVDSSSALMGSAEAPANGKTEAATAERVDVDAADVTEMREAKDKFVGTKIALADAFLTALGRVDLVKQAHKAMSDKLSLTAEKYNVSTEDPNVVWDLELDEAAWVKRLRQPKA